MSDLPKERIQKVLARAGVASRRQIEQMIKEKLIVVNGQYAEIGQGISPADHITVEGRRILLKESKLTPRVLMYHKPVDQICTHFDEQGRPTVYDFLPKLKHGRWISVGRLDINTSGLLLFTQDGELAHRLMHPSFEIEREYAVRVLGDISPDKLKRLTSGVRLQDGMAKFNSLRAMKGSGANQWFRVMLKEGRQREVRRIWEAIDVKVSRLVRIRYSDIRLPRDLKATKTCELDNAEVLKLLKRVGMRD